MGRVDREETGIRRIAYSALASQRKFHQSAARFKGFSGPIGSGKSQALCHEAIRLCYLNPGRMGLIGAPTYPMLRDSTQNALFEILAVNDIPNEWSKADNIVHMLDTRSRIVFRPVDDFERLRGTNLAWFGLDELTYTPEAAWLRLEGRLRDPKASRLCGFAVWTPKGFDWVYERFISDPKRGYEVVTAAPFENRFLLNKIPDFYDRLRGSYDEEFFKQEVLGEYLNSKGSLVYHSFRREEHVRSLAVDQGGPLLWALDFNVDPLSSVVAQIVAGEVRVLDEIVLRRASTADACRAFGDRFGPYQGGLVVYGDATGNAVRTSSGRSDYEVMKAFFREAGVEAHFRVPRSNPLVRERVQLLNGRLKPAEGAAGLFVDPKCRELIKDFEQVSYKEQQRGVAAR